MRYPPIARCRPRRRASLFHAMLAAGACAVLPAPTVAVPCHDYNDVPHQLSLVDTPGAAMDVALGPGVVFLADWTAGLQVIDVTNPAAPQLVAGVDTPGEAEGIDAAGDHAYIADGTAGLAVFDVSNPKTPVTVGGVIIPGVARSVDIAGPIAYVAAGQAGLQIVDISNPSAPLVIGGVDTPGDARDVVVSGGIAYVADNNSLKVIDISDPTAPVIIGTAPGAGNGVSIKDGIAVLVASESCKVFDVSDPTNPIMVNSLGNMGANYAVDFNGDQMLIRESGALQIIDASDPLCMRITGTVRLQSSVSPFSVRMGMAVAGDLAFVPGGFLGLYVVGSIHSGPILGTKWFHPQLFGFTRDMAAGQFGPSTIAYVSAFWSDVAQGLVVFDLTEPVCAQGGPSSYFNGGRGVALDGNRLYVSIPAWQAPGRLSVFDLSNPMSPSLLGSLGGDFGGVAAAGAFAYGTLSPMVKVVDVSDPAMPFIAGEVNVGSLLTRIVVAGEHVYAATGAGLRVIDVSEPSAPVVVGSLATAQANNVTLDGDLAFVVTQNPDELLVIDVSDPTQPTPIGQVGLTADPSEVEVAGDHAYVVITGGDLVVVDISDPAFPAITATASGMGGLLQVVGGQLVVAQAASASLMPLQCSATTAVEPLPISPAVVTLRAIPNPFHAQNVLEYGLSRSAQVRLRVYDVEGRLVRVLEPGTLQSEGMFRAVWDGADTRGNRVGAGVYFYRLETGHEEAVQRVVRLH